MSARAEGAIRWRPAAEFPYSQGETLVIDAGFSRNEESEILGGDVDYVLVLGLKCLRRAQALMRFMMTM
jgi:hypothetical protein